MVNDSIIADFGQGGILLFDEADLLERLDDDREFAMVILEESLLEIPRFLVELRNHSATGDCTAIHHSSHTLKGMAANISALRLQDIAMRIEHAARDSRADLVTALLPELEQVAQQTVDTISTVSL
jgi:HPt (histidine-containing phosphotransfer) domain-containing protein